MSRYFMRFELECARLLLVGSSFMLLCNSNFSAALCGPSLAEGSASSALKAFPIYPLLTAIEKGHFLQGFF